MDTFDRIMDIIATIRGVVTTLGKELSLLEEKHKSLERSTVNLAEQCTDMVKFEGELGEAIISNRDRIAALEDTIDETFTVTSGNPDSR